MIQTDDSIPFFFYESESGNNHFCKYNVDKGCLMMLNLLPVDNLYLIVKLSKIG